MKTLKALTLASITSVSLFAAFNSSAGMDPYIESALINVCKSAQSDDLGEMRSTIKGYHLNEKTVAMKVVCNGENIINFAENSGAHTTASHLEKRLGSREIVDLAQSYAVNF